MFASKCKRSRQCYRLFADRRRALIKTVKQANGIISPLHLMFCQMVVTWPYCLASLFSLNYNSENNELILYS